MKTFLIDSIYRKGEIDTTVLLSGRVILHFRPIKLWKYFKWATFRRFENGALTIPYAYQCPWFLVVFPFLKGQ